MDDENWLQRLKDEHEVLDIRINKLQIFLLSERFNEVDETYKRLLRAQLSVMETYLVILDIRLVMASA